jgi:hypothetical protein
LQRALRTNKLLTAYVRNTQFEASWLHFSIAAEKDPGSTLDGKTISLLRLLDTASDPFLLQHKDASRIPHARGSNLTQFKHGILSV